MLRKADCQRKSKPVFLGGAAVRSVNGDDAPRYLFAVGKVRERPAMLVNRREVDIEAGDVFDVAGFEFAHGIEKYGEHVVGRVPPPAGELHSLRQRLVLFGGPAARHLFVIQFPAVAVQRFSPPVSALTEI